MSDSDDTDFLLLIPPNFFLIQSSDSDDEFRITDFSRNKNEIERAVVNDLITQVNELESRVCAIESSDGSCSLSCNGFCNRSLDSIDFKKGKLINGNLQGCRQMPVSSQSTGSLDNVYHSRNYDLSVDRRDTECHEFSLPFSSLTVPYKKQLLSSGDKNIDQLCKTPNPRFSFNLGSANHEIDYCVNKNIQKSGCECINNSNLVCLKCSVNKSDYAEINKQFDDKEKADSFCGHLGDENHAHQTVSNISSLENTAETRSNSLIMNDDSAPRSKPADDDCVGIDVPHKSGKHFELSEVDKLLKQMEDTQLEIEKKLKLREMHYNISKSDDCKRNELYKVGDTINSVPDLGYGVRDLFYRKPAPESSNSNGVGNTTNKVDNKDPIIEEPCTQKKISTLGQSVEWDNRELCNIKDTLSPRSPYKHDYKSTPVSAPVMSDRDVSLSKARKKIDFSPLKDKPVSLYFRSPSKLSDGRDNKEDPENHLSLNKSFDGNSSDEEERKKKILSPQRLIKSKVKHPRMFREFDKRCFHNGKSNFRHGAGERALNFERSSGSRSSNLMSLSDLWSSGVTDSGIRMENDPIKLSQKLEEEKYRRQHCEQQIHELQKRVLDGQERLAVAVQVDREKDLAIQKLWNGWQQLANHWTELEEQRHSLSKQLEAQSKAYDIQADDIKKKVDRWEKELSKALDLAAGYKEKCQLIALEREEFKQEMEKKMKEALDELSSVKNENEKFIEEKNQLMERLNVAQSESEKDRQLVTEYQKKLVEVEQKLNQLEAEILILREQKENLSLKLKEERDRNKSITEQKLALQQMVDDYKKQEKVLKDEVRAATERLEVSRVELRALYQGQLEAVVKEKLREFQSQLNAAEAALRAELLAREKELAEQAAQQCHIMAESHKMELAGLDEKYRSQFKALTKKMEEIESQKIEAELKLKHETDRRTEIAQKLHSVMETQWRQALNIISSTAASGDAKSQMEWSGTGDHEDMKLDLKKLNVSQPNSARSSNQDTAPFNKSGGMSTYRLAATETAAASVNSKENDKNDKQYLKKYIQMLLDRKPGNPLPGIQDQTSSSLGTDDMQLINTSNVTNDSSLTDSQLQDKSASSKDREKFSNKQKGLDGMIERKQQLQNINRIFKQQPWK